MSDPAKAIVNLIRHRCSPLATAKLHHSESEPWRSLLFDGGRHRIEMRVSGAGVTEALDRLQAQMGAEEFAIPGNLIVDITLADIRHDGGDACVRLNALTIEDRG